MKYKGSEAINSSGCTQTMGFIGYYRSFVINFSCWASTINDLLQDKKDLFSLSEKQKKKNHIIQDKKFHQCAIHWRLNIIAYWKFSLISYFIHQWWLILISTDHSPHRCIKIGLGSYFLSEAGSWKLQVIANVSRTLTPMNNTYHLHSVKIMLLVPKWAVGYSSLIHFS